MRIFTALLLLLTLALPAQAQQTEHATARLFSPLVATGSAEQVSVAVEITMEKGWKTYWRTPGDAGLAPVFDWAGSENFKAAVARYPAPHRFTVADMDNFGYHDRVIFPLDVTLVEAGKPLSLALKLDILVCSDICVPETKNLSFTLPAGEATPSRDSGAYNDAIAALPQTVEGAFTQAYIDFDRENRNYLVVSVQQDSAPARDGDLFVENDAAIVFGKPEVSYDSRTKIATYRAPAHSTATIDALNKALSSGDLTFTLTHNGTAIEGKTMLGTRPAGDADGIAPSLSDKAREFDLRILLIALLGGLVLNLMPCVLPVLSMKVLSVLSHGGKSRENRGQIFRNFMASALGIVFSFWVMASALAVLKASGESIGWGIQFQHPVFLVFLIVILVGFAANMFDVFEIPLPRFIARHIPARHEHEPTLVGHFMTGAFATLLATPCTAPFLGTAVGFALARGTFEIFVIFTFLGLGLALPYMLLALSPGLFKYMPKPGRWMRTLKRFMALLLLITAGWLANVLVTVTTTPALDDGWQKFDAALIQPAVEEGRTVVVDITADWCLTCKANKKLVLQKKDVVEALSAPNIVRLQADWTHRDETIAEYLRSFGKYGIPFNVVYGPAAPEGIVLPELLTKDAVLHALTEAAGE